MAVSVQVGMEGADVDTIQVIASRLPGIATRIAKQESYWACVRMRTFLQKGIQNQMGRRGGGLSHRKIVEFTRDPNKPHFELAPLKKSYVRWKKRRGLDTRILIATGRYWKSIEIQKVNGIVRRKGRKGAIVLKRPDKGDDGFKDVAYIVTVPDKMHPALPGKKGKGLPYKVLQKILEYGSRKAHIRPRPHWRPTWQDFKKRGRPQLVKRARTRTVKEVRALVQSAKGKRKKS